MISWEERFRLILALIDKDRKIPVWMWITAVVVAIIALLLTLPAALSLGRYATLAGWSWNDSSLRSFYAVSTALTSLILGLTFASFHQGEVRRGTIRSIILYPVDMNDITIAKLASSLIVSAILSTILFAGIFGGFFLARVFPVADFLVIHFVALAMSFVALASGVFLSHAIAHAAGRMVVSPSALGAIFLLFSVLMTETALTAIGIQIASLVKPPGTFLTIQEIEGVVRVAQAFSVFSPHHVGARIVGIAFGITRIWADLHVVVPIAALIFAGGYLFGKKLYLDIFIR